ncbi:hypothetical protein CHS0354_007930 [Potamilus streckersoni]|uniref:C1q domain-containing protein n=1 Tax=Potamilus streckersoni TaxID=2493646 RepID=A0AAE0S8Y1_9BIVA|nr:hypothetical protein CHS0354_007930 [Potamilus streckersoni]
MTHAEVVVYDRIFANIGGGFDPHTGIFTCTQAGLYVFQFHSLADSDQASWLELYHNSYYVCSTYGHTTNDYASSGNSVVLRLSKGDQVYVKAVDQSFGSTTVLFGASDEVYSTFSGYLIAPVFEEFPIVGK